MEEGQYYKLTAMYTFLPKMIYIMQIRNEKIWFVDVPRTMPTPRYFRQEHLDKYYIKQ